MPLKTDTQSLRDQVRLGMEFAGKFLEEVDTLSSRTTGRYYRSDRQPDRPITENHFYEYLGVMKPSVAYDNPRVRIRAGNPLVADDAGIMTMGDMALGIELGLNRWSIDTDLWSTLDDLATDYFYCWAVSMVTIADQPGFQGAELVPQRPYIVRIPPHHFVIDPAALSNNPLQSNGPRFMGHMWKADHEDLLKDDDYDSKIVAKLALDQDLEKYHPERKHGTEIPPRGEILAWDVWVPEHQTSKRPEFNGTIFTIAVGNTPDGMTKKAQQIREPRPAYCGPWGPYIMHGYMKVKDSPFPLSPMVAVAEQAEEVNAHTTAAAEAARAYKRFGYGEAQNAADGDRIKAVINGEFVLLDSVEGIGQMELGGASDAQNAYSNLSRERLNRVSGLSDALRGEVTGDVTATESSIADSGTKMRISGIKGGFRKFVARSMRAAAWFFFYGEDVVQSLGEEGLEHGLVQFTGGIQPGMENFNFFDLSLTVDPLSIEHTDQAILQRRIQLAYESLVNNSGAMVQAPWINWREPIRVLFESLNIGQADDWVDFDRLAKEQERIERMKQVEEAQLPYQNMGGGTAGGTAGGRFIPEIRLGADREGIPGSLTGRAQVALAGEIGNEAGAGSRGY